jgi:hypothetical protein
MADAQLPEDPIVQLERVRRQRQARPKADSRPEFSDDALALGFADEHRDKLRHVAMWGKWLLWRGSHWQTDDTLRVFDLARAKCRDVGAAVIQSHSEKLAAAMFFLAIVGFDEFPGLAMLADALGRIQVRDAEQHGKARGRARGIGSHAEDGDRVGGGRSAP